MIRSTKFILLLAALLALSACSLFPSGDKLPKPFNVALNKPAVADSERTQDGHKYEAKYAVDGIYDQDWSRWQSLNTATYPAPHWLEIDLEGTYVLSSSTIWTGILGSSGPDSGTAPAKYFRLQYWKDDGWVDIPGASISNTPKGTGRVEFTFEEEVVTTKVRLVAEDDDFVRFREVMIFGLPMED